MANYDDKIQNNIFSTACIHAGVEADPTTGATLTPIYQTTTYTQAAIGCDKGYTYSRSGNPTVSALEKKLGILEGGKTAVCFSSGMAAITALFLALLKSGDHILCSDVVYGGTVRLLHHVLKKLGIEATFVDTSKPELIKKAIRSNTRLLFIETPANPTLKLTDIKQATDAAHSNSKGILCAVDNTFLTPVLQQPLALGADIVVHSTTKYIDGHNATIGGALIAKDTELTEQFRFIQNTVGFIQSPFNAWLTLQGVKTLPIRIKQHSENALTIARFLEQHPKIKQVTYPGLKSFPQYQLAQTQQQGHGGMLTFELVGGFDTGIQLLNTVKRCALAENLGAIETLITHPASMTHAEIHEEQRNKIGITDGLVRLSVGLEDPNDIIQDLSAALEHCGKSQ